MRTVAKGYGNLYVGGVELVANEDLVCESAYVDVSYGKNCYSARSGLFNSPLGVSNREGNVTCFAGCDLRNRVARSNIHLSTVIVLCGYADIGCVVGLAYADVINVVDLNVGKLSIDYAYGLLSLKRAVSSVIIDLELLFAYGVKIEIGKVCANAFGKLYLAVSAV